MRTGIAIVFILAQLVARYDAAVCRPLTAFNKQFKGQDVPSLDSVAVSGTFMGAGSFGEVHAVQWPYTKLDNQLVAIKKLNLDPKRLAAKIKDLESEVSVMKILGDDDAGQQDAMEVEETQGVRTRGAARRNSSAGRKGRARSKPKRQNVKAKAKVDNKAQVAAALNENLGAPAPSIIDCVIDRKTSSAYVVMELLSGNLGVECIGDANAKCPAAKWVKKPIEQRLITFGQIAHALHGMHERGYVHDDLKPDNIGSTDDSISNIKLIDFGLSQKIGHRMQGGTDLYMDYDKLRWFTGELSDEEQKTLAKSTREADVYSLGMIMFAMEYAAAAIKANVAADPFAEFDLEADDEDLTAMDYFKAVMKMLTDGKALKAMNFFTCVPGGQTFPGQIICLYKIYYGLIHPDRAQRLTLPQFMTVLEHFVLNIKQAEAIPDKMINKIVKMSVEQAYVAPLNRIILI